MRRTTSTSYHGHHAAVSIVAPDRLRATSHCVTRAALFHPCWRNSDRRNAVVIAYGTLDTTSYGAAG